MSNQDTFATDERQPTETTDVMTIVDILPEMKIITTLMKIKNGKMTDNGEGSDISNYNDKEQY